ncbi:hypothetical protein [Stigmatella aurantiaca]|uniref:hypothetical protein n=1 Tax=Stigmatella aurantiaca TaxID=41 RepID=UPI00059FC943|nr:hypothetical protein [Stigmatella aurantiaca]
MRTLQASSFAVFALVAAAVVAVSAQAPRQAPAQEEAVSPRDITACGTALQSSATDVSSASASMPRGPWGSCRGDCSPCLGPADCEHAGGGWICDPECM